MNGAGFFKCIQFYYSALILSVLAIKYQGTEYTF